jgi:two-component system, OmpR family, sensor kinase
VLDRIPIRLRLTLAFALAMAVVLAATGAFLYFRLATTLDEAVDQSVEARAVDVQVAVERGERGVGFAESGLDAQDERLVQVVALSGAVIAETPNVGGPVLEPDDRARAAQGVVWLVLDEVSMIDGRVRVVALPAQSPEGPRVVVVGASLEDRDETLGGFVTELLLIGPAALLLASLLGYGVATAALRPVEAMRAEAAAVSAAEPGRRLPVPRSRDEISRLGATLNEMLGRLERALERERSFVADASHELRTPLALLKTELELALRSPRSEAELEQALRSVAGETDRLAQLVEDLLVLARSDEGRLPLRRAPSPARELLSIVAERFRRRADAAGRTIGVEAPEGLVLAADAVRLEQALGNLVENALRHGRGSTRLAAREREGGVELHVLDEGAGFPPAFVDRAFERFTRADEARTEGGAGLGLAIVQVIAEAHGGSAHASGRPAGGADVWLALPDSARA